MGERQQRAKIERQREVAKFRLRGVTDQRHIAAQLGVSQPTISRDFAELDVHFQAEADADIRAAKGIDLARLDAMIDAIWSEAMKGDAKTWHIDRILKCLERRAALLGLDAPQKREESLHITLQRLAATVAQELDLEPAELVAEAERIIAQAAR